MTGLISTSGQQFADWSAAYRLFSRDRVSTDHLFTGVRDSVVNLIPPSRPVCLALDDSLFRRTGTKIPGVGWRRDPLGPKFHTNFIRAQRFLQISAAVPTIEHTDIMRMIPIDFLHCPSVPKPGHHASEEQFKQYRRECKAMSLSAQAGHRVSAVCSKLPMDANGQLRAVHLLVDGQYTNGTLLKSLPPQATLIGRIRKDAKLHYQPNPCSNTRPGRRLLYGPIAPTPEQIRTDETYPWQQVRVFASGAFHDCRVKTITGLMWRTAGARCVFKLVVIAPLHYRPRAGSKLLYRQPAFLICSDPNLDTQQIVQQYIWRWDVEVNFREEKSLLGVSDAQVRNRQATESLPAFRIAIYAMLLLAGIRWAGQRSKDETLPPPKWRAHSKPLRISTQILIHQIRAEVWGRGLGLPTNFSDFSSHRPAATKSEKLLPSLSDALLYCNA